MKEYAGNTKGGSITVPLTSCLAGLEGVSQNGQISFLKNGKEHCGYMVCGSKKFFVPFENYEPNTQPTL